MSIPVRSVVSVDISVAGQFPSAPGFSTTAVFTTTAGLLTDKDDLYQVQRIKSYSSPDEVATDWNTDSQAYKAANTYFSQNPRPETVKIAIRNESATSATLVGSIVDDLTLFTGISDGSFAANIDGDPQDITGLDFTADASLSDVAATVQAALQLIGSGGYTAATCEYNSTEERFVIKSGTTGSTSTISVLGTTGTGTDVSSVLAMDVGNGLSINGTDAETVTDSLNAVEQLDDDWYGLTFTKEVRDTVMINGESAVEAAAAWAEARIKKFYNTTNDPNSLVSGAVTIGSMLHTNQYRRTLTTYSSFPDQYPSASVAGREATTDFDQPNSTITLKFKQLPGIAVEDLSTTQKSNLDAIRVNAYVNVGGVPIYAESFMAADGVFSDEVIGIDWLTADMQTQVFGYVSSQNKVPITDKGGAALEQQLRVSLDRAVANGLAAPGVAANGEFLAEGYKITVTPISQLPQSDITARHYAGLSFVILGAGAIHSVQIDGVFER